jgi:hypothetical protein
MGCVPVTVTDGVLQPFEPEMSWSGWSVALPERDIPQLHDILNSITPQELEKMQVNGSITAVLSCKCSLSPR